MNVPVAVRRTASDRCACRSPLTRGSAGRRGADRVPVRSGVAFESNRGRVSSAFGPLPGSGAEHPSRRSGSSIPGTGLYGRIGGRYQEQKPVESAILVPAVRVDGARGRGAPEGKGVARWPASATSAFDLGRIDPVETRPSGAAPQLRSGIVAPDRRGKFRVATGGTVQIRDEAVTVRLIVVTVRQYWIDRTSSCGRTGMQVQQSL